MLCHRESSEYFQSSAFQNLRLADAEDGSQDSIETVERPKSRATRFEFPEPKKSSLPYDQARKQDISNAEELEIKDLCDLIKNIHKSSPDDDRCLGLLPGVDNVCYGLYNIKARSNVQPPLASIHVGESLRPSHNGSDKRGRVKRQKLSQSIRYEAAFTLGTTVLQLHSTPWLENWAKSDILYLPDGQRDADRSLIQPYISRRFSSSKSPDSARMTSDARNNPNIWVANETLLTLCVVLIELAYNKPIEVLAEAREETQIPIVTAQLVAKRLSKQISSEMGQLYQSAVEWCLSCDLGFTRTKSDLHSDEFQQGFLEHVVVPLQESTDFFSSTSLSRLNSRQ